ncbi:CHAT domain-containing protein [Streptomyces afghaniensis]|uniref:CHAT domain-containing protein n=1 Tax=Streptomyces afghaniensis TaxID=66865 RepID=UPI0033AF2B42
MTVLPRLSNDRLESTVRTLHRALRAADQALKAKDRPGYLRQQRTVGSVLELLWDELAVPVWAVADSGPAPSEGRARRIWWVPSGLLWFLPLHAATSPGGASLADLAVSSYAPTVRMLQESRRRRPGPGGDPLVVTMPDTPGATPLPGAGEEAAVLRGLFPAARELRGPRATRSAFESALPDHSWLHFAGHGVNAPEGTRLLLHDCEDDPLSAQDVLRMDLPRAELAYLSACESAQTSVQLPDEATHFGATLAVAGFRDVIGTLWRVTDPVAVRAARSFYGALAAGDCDPALALHRTVQELRAAYPSMPGLWASHVHIGP